MNFLIMVNERKRDEKKGKEGMEGGKIEAERKEGRREERKEDKKGESK